MKWGKQVVSTKAECDKLLLGQYTPLQKRMKSCNPRLTFSWVNIQWPCVELPCQLLQSQMPLLIDLNKCFRISIVALNTTVTVLLENAEVYQSDVSHRTTQHQPKKQWKQLILYTPIYKSPFLPLGLLSVLASAHSISYSRVNVVLGVSVSVLSTVALSVCSKK